MYACPEQSSSASSEKESVIMVLQESVKTSSEETAGTGRNQPSVMAAEGLRPRQLFAHQREKPVVSSRQRAMKLQRKDAGGRKSEQHPSHPHPKPSSVQGAVECVHQKSDSTATNECARLDHQSSPESSSAGNQPSLFLSSVVHWCTVRCIFHVWCCVDNTLSCVFVLCLWCVSC